MTEPTTYWQLLAVEADQGRLFLNPEAAEKCSRVRTDDIEKLVQHQKTAKTLVNVKGWGDFDSGKQLQKVFAEKAAGGPNNMVDVLQGHINVVEEMKTVFGKFFVATEDGDDANAADLGSRGPN